MSYTYNADGTPASKTDAKNQQVQYTYDSYRRVTQIRRYPVAGGAEDLCQRTSFTYDSGTNGWGRLTSETWGGSSCAIGPWSQSYEYTPAGLPTRKTLTQYWSLVANYTYDNEGKMVSVQYPNSGPAFTYTYDTMGRPIKLTNNQTQVDWAKDVIFNAAGQITQMKYSLDTSGSVYNTETRAFNVLQQLTRLTVPGALDHEYRFSPTQNNGRITQRKDWISGEEISYQYDSLNRLISAVTTGPQWGQSFTYDGFGNMLAQTVTKGQAPTLSVNVDPATNRITTGGYSYDSNGNLTAMPLLATSYNVDNRLAQAVSSLNGTDQFVYDPQGQRVAKNENGVWKVYFYGIDGNLLGTSSNDYNIYFGRKLIYTQSYPAGPVVEDRLASTVKHFPYGEEPSTTNQNRTKFATYFRDATTALDCAQQRYYARTIGRFTTVDRSGKNESLTNPTSFNRYTYVNGDPVNFNDPSGLGFFSFFRFLADSLGDFFGGGGGGNTPYVTSQLSFDAPEDTYIAETDPEQDVGGDDPIYGVQGQGAQVVQEVGQQMQGFNGLLGAFAGGSAVAGAAGAAIASTAAVSELVGPAITSLNVTAASGGAYWELSNKTLSSFTDGVATKVIANADVAVQRVFDNIKSFQTGWFFTSAPTAPITSSAQAQTALNLGQWNQATQVINAVIPAGTTYYSGTAAGGGGVQIFVNPACVVFLGEPCLLP